MSRIINFKPRHNRKWLFIFVISLIIIAIGGFCLVVLKPDFSSIAGINPRVCTTAIIDQYNIAITSGPIDYDKRLDVVINDVKSKSGYATDTNCLVILSNYYIYKSDAINARKYYEKLKASIKDGGTIDKQLDGTATTANIEASIKSLDTRFESGHGNGGG